MTARYETWRGFRLIPDDVLFFRDGRPATRGDDHYLPSIFPPHPSTLYGAVRTRRLLDEGVDLTKLGPNRAAAWKDLPEELRAELGEWGGFGSLELRGPWLVRGEDEVLLPAPGDLAVVTAPAGEGTGSPKRPGRREEPEPPTVERVARFLPAEDPGDGGGHSHPLGLLRPAERSGGGWKAWDRPQLPPKPAHGWYLTPAGFTRWAEGGAPEPEDFVHADALWAAEPRVGVGLEDRDRSAREGHLFTFGFVRLREHVTLGFEVRHAALEPRRRVRLGGEGRTCWLEDGPGLPETPARPDARVRLALATPLLSATGGWLPSASPSTPEAELDGRGVRLRAGVLPRHVHVGGWDLAKGGPKPLRRAAPAGTTWSVEAADGSGPLDPAGLHGLTHTDYPGEELARQGFGLLLAGADPEGSS